jgi:uncharacterized protein (DUF2267 family)
MALGVLIDALFVRPLLIPALIAVLGRATWWPSRLRPARSARAFHREVAERSGRDHAHAADLTHATLTTLAERIPAREADELARQLPGELSRPVARATHAQRFSSDEFIARVADRARISADDATHDAPLVVSVLAMMLADGELEYLRAVLPPDYAWLFGDAPPPRRHEAVAAVPARP